MGKQRRRASEVKKILQGYEQSGLTRRQYCSQIGLPVTTLDYYRTRWQGGRGRRQAEAPLAKQTLSLDEMRRNQNSLMRVELSAPAEPANPKDQAHASFTVALVQGQAPRIEISGARDFDEVLLGKLIRVVETA